MCLYPTCCSGCIHILCHCRHCIEAPHSQETAFLSSMICTMTGCSRSAVFFRVNPTSAALAGPSSSVIHTRLPPLLHCAPPLEPDLVDILSGAPGVLCNLLSSAISWSRCRSHFGRRNPACSLTRHNRIHSRRPHSSEEHRHAAGQCRPCANISNNWP